ncbi:hypothetical protein ACFVUW_25680 [Streptomyces xiamenensis]|uniref:hypothetical protein n=1 Tax=Streptomyces xiamenensis TaxID=408015 RepID=UPI0036E38437
MKVNAIGILIATASFVALQGCSGSTPRERAYAVPEDLCDVDISNGAYASLFPPGKSVKKIGMDPYEDGYLPAGGLCTVYVDRDPAIRVDTLGSRDRESGGGPIAPGIDAYLEERGFGLSITDSELIEEIPYEVRVWKNFAAVHIPCAESSGMDYTGMNVSIDLRENVDRDFSDDLKEIIEPYALDRIEMMGPGVCDNA